MPLRRRPLTSAFTGRHPYAAVAVTILLLGVVPTLTWALWPDRAIGPRIVERDMRYPTQSGSGSETRRQQIDNRADDQIDAAVETCGGIGLANMAEKYGIPPDAERVAEVFAGHMEPAYRDATRRGCLKGLLEGG